MYHKKTDFVLDMTQYFVCVRHEALTVLLAKIRLFWVVMLCP